MKIVFFICISAMFVLGITKMFGINESILLIAYTISVYILFKDEIKNKEKILNGGEQNEQRKG